MCGAEFINMRMDCYRCDIVWHMMTWQIKIINCEFICFIIFNFRRFCWKFVFGNVPWHFRNTAGGIFAVFFLSQVTSFLFKPEHVVSGVLYLRPRREGLPFCMVKTKRAQRTTGCRRAVVQSRFQPFQGNVGIYFITATFAF